MNINEKLLDIKQTWLQLVYILSALLVRVFMWDVFASRLFPTKHWTTNWDHGSLLTTFDQKPIYQKGLIVML